MTPDPLAAPRGIAWGLVISAFLWVAIFAVLAVIVVWP
jgi:hypothetical protein